MNRGIYSINRFCGVMGAFFSVISAAATAGSYFLTRNPAVVWLEVLVSALMFLCAAAFVAFLHHKLVLFSDSLCQTMDDMLEGAAVPPVIYEDETLFCKINHRLVRFYEVMQENRESAAKERADLQELISDISHQVKTPMANLQMGDSGGY